MTFAALTAPVQFSREQVAIALSHSELGAGHIGIAFHSAKQGPHVLHLAWHMCTRLEQVPDQLLVEWMAEPLAVPPTASKHIVAVVRSVASRGAKINYGLNFIAAKGSFQPNGSYKPPRGSDGLTCASFVVEVLRAASINLLDLATWRPGIQNEQWANAVCAHLERSASADHVVAVKSSINGLRLRPVEVAGGAQLGVKGWPASFDCVQEPAARVAMALDTICSKQPKDGFRAATAASAT